MKKTLTATTLIAAIGLGAAAAHAGSISSVIPKNELNQWSDNSAESQNVDANSDGFLGVGDTLRGILDIGTIEGLISGSTADIGGTSGNNELSGIFEAEVVALTILSDPDGSCMGSSDCSMGALSGDETANYEFGPNAAFNAEFGLGGSAMAVLFEDSTPDFKRLDLDATPESTALDGTTALVVGFSDVDDFWIARNALTDVSLAGSFLPSEQIGSLQLGLSFLANSLFPDWNQLTSSIATGRIGLTGGDGMVDFTGNGGILGTSGVNTTFQAFNNVDFNVIPVPEPETALLLGFSLLGLGVATRRRRRA